MSDMSGVIERDGHVLKEPPTRMAAHYFVADVVRWHPQTCDVFVSLGFAALSMPIVRVALTRRVTLAQAAMICGVSLAVLLDSVNRAIGAPAEMEHGGPVTCSGDCQQCACQAGASQWVGGHG